MRRNSLHENAPFGRITHERRVFRFRFLRFPYFLPQVADDGKLQPLILLGEGGHAVALHDRVGIFDSVAESAGGRIDNDLSVRHTEVAQEDVELFGKIDVDRAVGRQGMFIGNGAGADLLVIFHNNGADDEIHPVARLGDFTEQLGILLGTAAAVDDYRNIHRRCDLFGRFRCLIARGIQTVGIGADQLQGNHIGAIDPRRLLGPGNGIADDIPVRFQRGLRPVIGRRIVHLDGDAGGMGHFPLEEMKRIRGLPPHRDRVGSFSQHNFLDLSRIGRFWDCKCHEFYLLN